MKKFFLLVCIFWLSVTASAQTPNSFVKFPDEGIRSYTYKPEIGFCFLPDSSLLTILRYYSSSGYTEFGIDSQIWFKFSNDIILKTELLKNSAKGSCILLDSGYFCFGSLSTYNTDLNGILNQLSEKDNYIEKIRIVFSEYLYEDFVIQKGYKKKFKKRLIKSLKDSSWFLPEEF